MSTGHPMTQRRAEELALVFLKLLFAVDAGEIQEFDLPAGFSDEEFFEFLDIIAPAKMAELKRDFSEEIDLSALLEEASRRFREDKQTKLIAGMPCPACGKDKLEFYAENGIFDLSGNLHCPHCNEEFPNR